MTIETPAAAAPTSGRRDGGIAAVLRQLVLSAEPAVVFTSLARLCVPLFSDTCTIDIAEDDHASYRIVYPLATEDRSTCASPGAAAGAVRTRFRSVGLRGAPGYCGAIIFTWHGRQPAPGDVAQASALVCHAQRAIHLERFGGPGQAPMGRPSAQLPPARPPRTPSPSVTAPCQLVFRNARS